MQSEAEETRPQKARKLAAERSFGVLATLLERIPGFPFGSVAPYAVDSQGRPLFLISTMAVHTQNLLAVPKASLLVYEPEAETDPLSAARMNLIGEVREVPGPDAAEVRRLYLERHPDAEQYIDFGDFSLYRMEIEDVYYIGGFGEMGWVSRHEYTNAA
jgi:putative heme iron utilization protein